LSGFGGRMVGNPELWRNFSFDCKSGTMRRVKVNRPSELLVPLVDEFPLRLELAMPPTRL
jgi:hypothetical protein